MPAVTVDSKGRLRLPQAIRRELGIRAGDVVFCAVVGNEVRLAKARDPFAHLSGDELLDAHEAWLRANPDQVAEMKEEMADWQAPNLSDLEPEEWDAETRAPRTR